MSKQIEYRLTDAQVKSLNARMQVIGKELLIDRLENAMINANMILNLTTVRRLEASIAYIRKQMG